MPEHIETAISKAYQLHANLEVSGMALWSETDNRTFEKAGGSSLLEMGAELAAEIIDGLERGAQSTKPQAAE